MLLSGVFGLFSGLYGLLGVRKRHPYPPTLPQTNTQRYRHTHTQQKNTNKHTHTQTHSPLPTCLPACLPTVPTYLAAYRCYDLFQPPCPGDDTIGVFACGLLLLHVILYDYGVGALEASFDAAACPQSFPLPLAGWVVSIGLVLSAGAVPAHLTGLQLVSAQSCCALRARPGGPIALNASVLSAMILASRLRTPLEASC